MFTFFIIKITLTLCTLNVCQFSHAHKVNTNTLMHSHLHYYDSKHKLRCKPTTPPVLYKCNVHMLLVSMVTSFQTSLHKQTSVQSCILSKTVSTVCYAMITTHPVGPHEHPQIHIAAPSPGGWVGSYGGRSCEGISPLDCPAPDHPHTRASAPDHCRMMPA